MLGWCSRCYGLPDEFQVVHQTQDSANCEPAFSYTWQDVQRQDFVEPVPHFQAHPDFQRLRRKT
jgi:hypothetical protein